MLTKKQREEIIWVDGGYKIQRTPVEILNLTERKVLAEVRTRKHPSEMRAMHGIALKEIEKVIDETLFEMDKEFEDEPIPLEDIKGNIMSKLKRLK